jgi:uncharacterized protein (TIGR03435 family)
MLLLSLLLVFAGNEIAQDFTHFEVASVKLAEPFPGATPGMVPVIFPVGGIGTSNPRQITYRGTWLSGLILEAYNLRGFQVSGPVPNDRYDIIANIPEGATKEQFRVMLQNLLHERFNLSFHHESKIFPGYVLVVGKNGPKLKESPEETTPPPANTAKGHLDDDGFPVLSPTFSGVNMMPGNGRMRASAQRVGTKDIVHLFDGTFGTLAGIDGPIVDETGLTGQYDFKLEFEYKRPGTPADTSVDAAPTAFAALEQQLGLKLESKRVPFDMLVVDRLDKVPTAN